MMMMCHYVAVSDSSYFTAKGEQRWALELGIHWLSHIHQSEAATWWSVIWPVESETEISIVRRQYSMNLGIKSLSMTLHFR